MKLSLSRVARLLPAGRFLRVLAPAILALAAMVAVVLTVANSEAFGPPPDLWTGFNLPFPLEPGRDAPVFKPRSPLAQPTPVPNSTPVASVTQASPCHNGTVVPPSITNPGLLADCELLWAMKQGFTNGDEKLNWNADTDIRLWNGLLCDNVGGDPWRVRAVDLGAAVFIDFYDFHSWDTLHVSYDLEGSISLPAHLVRDGGFSALLSLDLNQNKLAGSIPPQLGSLDNLEYLDLGGNRLSGSIPTRLGNLEDLVELYLNGNQMTGAIPGQLGNLSSLVDMDLGDNRLTGSIPGQLGSLGNLEYLNLSENLLSGSIPSRLGNLPRLITLTLANNLLSNSIPASLGNLANLESLDLSGNQLSGPIPTELGNLSSLSHLWIAGNRLTGCISEGLRNVESNDFHLEDFSRLDPFCFEPRQAPTPVPQRSDTDRPALEALYRSTGGADWSFNENWLSEKPLHQWEGVISNSDGRVTELDLRNNNLRGSIPTALGNLSELESLSLGENSLSGPIPTQLGNLSELESLSLGENELSGSLPASLGNLSELKWLYLDNNQLSGSIPGDLGDLANLLYLHLDNNQLSGSIPSRLSRLNNLVYMYLDNNQLSGSIPWKLGVLSDLKALTLNNNNLSGSLPSQDVHTHSLSTMHSLIRLNLANNQLSGPISISRLPKLNGAHFAGNQFTGCLPGWLRKVSFNDFAETGLDFCRE